MATTITGIGQTKIVTNLDTYTHTALLASLYAVSLQLQELPPSGCTITIQHNGSTVASTSAPAAAQSVIDLGALILCAVSDTLSIIVASSNPTDQGKNVLKGVLKISPGPVQ